MAPPGGTAWLRDDAGETYPIHVSQRDLEYKFEVFTLSIPTRSELEAEVARWEPPTLPLGKAPSARDPRFIPPSVPSPVAAFEPWPLPKCTMKVLRRTEFIVEDVNVPSLGSNPSMQSAARLGDIPAGANAICEVAAGLLFVGADRARLLIAVDWFPFNTLVTDDPEVISAYCASCEEVDVRDYAELTKQ